MLANISLNVIYSKKTARMPSLVECAIILVSKQDVDAWKSGGEDLIFAVCRVRLEWTGSQMKLPLLV